jgi:hypothetical protein
MTPSGGGEAQVAPLSEYGVRVSLNGFNFSATICSPDTAHVERASGASIA